MEQDNHEMSLDKCERETSKRALDELFTSAAQYRTSEEFNSLLTFISRFKKYSFYNCMLMHTQMPGARFVLPPSKWLRDYGRKITPGARPLVILQPMGPVMFVFDVSDTFGQELPTQVENPFNVKAGKLNYQLETTIYNCKRDGISVHYARLGSQQAGSIRCAITSGKNLDFENKKVSKQYELELDNKVSKESNYATLVHELGHLYCGHLGTPNKKWWPDRRDLDHNEVEFEAESVAYLVCSRMGIESPSEKYLSGYFENNNYIPDISLDAVMKSANLIEKMGIQTLKLRKK